MRGRATVVLDGFGVLESLRWHDDALWFCDLAHGTVHRWDTRGEPETVAEVPGRAGGLGWLPDGRMLVVSMDGHCVYRREPDGSLVVHADLKGIAGGPANDMFVDRLGRAYVGNFGFDYHGFVRRQPNSMLYAPPGPPRTPIACFSPEGELLGLSEPLVFPNGMFLVDDDSTLLVAETLAMRLTALPVLPDGRLGPPRPWAPLIPSALWASLNHPGPLGRVTRRVSALLDRPAIAARSASPIAPDGMAPGRDGTAWVANALRGECVRVGPGGVILDRVATSRQTLSCVVAGPDGDTLYAATTPTDDPVRAAGLNGSRLEAFVLPS
ncbi:SMP-30/gluconolactonase/LRE family protein [Streptomyces sp. WI04-05B]|uniref:SMP-30/gluconolactonase/LRE family protein n=1 Tax=Streptomyces TaxID=1883 RepID=UPI0029AC9A12|nr:MULTISPECIES: SMP-30/gluconolactonase/LRE family protein [unclassified Streptomyces]MDX2547954.1 SMP-30/gluconolactonase/LRE family protein [Streptomyces sp. WI04-05B]MDX2582815.1 SMP-30/gluconolactonase/LRE family protein [Streptomyces sp. WI04-05A]MDX3746870.1 SMP-30/gluconolactonase/LRE family protein [Streptomyces sp. AK08-02]